MQPFAAGDRVVYTDPDAPRGHAMRMRGEVVAADAEQVVVTYDAYAHLPEDNHARRITFTAADAVRTLAWEQQR